MGSKHNKKRFLIIKYSLNNNGQYDELVELSKKKCGPGKIKEAGIVLDLVNKEVLKCDVPGNPQSDNLKYENVYEHFHKAYGKVLDQFIK